jgi:cytochrome c biogenesis protein CcmG/thiol:disulfide interchange protein DsbE
MNILTTIRRRWIVSLTLLIVLAMLGLLVKGLFLDPRELPSALINKPWPERALPQLGSAAADGQPIGPAQLRGKARLVNVWASWCSVCVDEQPEILALSKILGAQGRADQLIGLNYRDPKRNAADWRQKTGDASAWLQRYGNPFGMTLIDADGRMGIELGVYGAPESFLIDERGVIVWKHVGALTPEVIAREVLPRLGAHS